MDLRLTGTVVLVTGASRGLGAAMAIALAREGAYVVATARSEDSLAEVAAQGEGRISTIAADMRDESSVRAIVPEVIGRHGRVDGLVNNAGIAPAGKFATQDPAVWTDALAVNVVAPMLLAQAAGVHMIEQGGGRIVNIASTTGLRGKPYLVPYSTSKGAVVRFTEALAAEWAAKNVQVNCIAPGAFVTDAQKAVTESPELHAKRIAKIPAGRMADPSELVPLACLLVSPLSSFTTGATFVVDGGESGKL
ncbi:SDR family oxidoreductase [Nocardioides carbamazepini]|jgi:2-deoxy-D-gluconate 3-dehydrogenase|uniref:SDR family NAD(P)-dependent oxidoreductase n=1 Tax=Nocardioides TaxID=1839 RepID=UPI002149B9B6|nr:SDR family oxidoreductase [Nocardioides carbamazepini]MCR1786296.1 SDR family oxidoreductase [Nocardioides carbamazepini]MDQ6523436.1 SDR family oxidoreductase [Nocardioides sp. LHD-245]